MLAWQSSSNLERGIITDTLRAGDGERAAVAMRIHLKAARAALRNYLANKDGELR